MSSALDTFRGWHLDIECGGVGCPVGRTHRVDALVQHYPGATVGAVLIRLKCVDCGRGIESAVLSQARPLRRVPLRGSEVRF
jgi:hypothetical protein